MIRSEAIPVNEAHWDVIISNCKTHDFYHTRSYHSMETEGSGDTALLFVSYANEEFIALPLVLREIVGTSYFDCTSVYGYCGPVSNATLEDGASLLIQVFQNQLLKFFRKKNIVAAFSRLHPMIETHKVFDSFGKLSAVNKTVAIDLRFSLEEQRRQYRKSNKSEINQLRNKKGYTVKEAETEEEIEAFVHIYNETMKRVNAADYYFFETHYFHKMLQNPNYEATILLAIKDSEITAGAIFTVTHKVMQYHLAGTKEEYIYDTPMKLILDEARLRGHRLQLDFLHLGGGVGGSDDDSLFRFKSGFSKQFFQFSTWQLIVNEEAYKELADINGVTQSDFFPLYRAPNNT